MEVIMDEEIRNAMEVEVRKLMEEEEIREWRPRTAVNMRKHIVNELEVAAPANTLWEIYSSLQFPNLVAELLPNVFQNIEIDGDGSPGTVLNVVFVPGTMPPSYKGKYVTIDHENRLKEMVHIEGGYLEIGCSFYMNSFQIVEKDCESCIIKSMVTYELAENADPTVEDLVDNIVVLTVIAQGISKYVLDKQSESAP